MVKIQTGKNRWLWVSLALIFVSLACVSTVNFVTITPPPEITPTVTEEVMGDTTGDWYEVYFTNPVTPFDNVYSGGIEEHLIEKIDSAITSIDLAVYEFDLESVSQALIRAKQRGVVIRVVYDNEYSNKDPQMAELTDAGIATVPDLRSAYMHNKFFIFDDNCVWTGSFNISVNAAYRNNENAFYFCSPEAAANYKTEFDEMYSGEFGPSSPSDTPYPIFTVDGVTVENYFAPEDDVMDKVIASVNKAQQYIHFMAYSFTDDALADAMLLEMNQGVVISGIFESLGANTPSSECKTLLQAGADVFLDGNPRTFHHKVIIIDGKIVIFGSFNFYGKRQRIK
jgi:phosphatidylserine/phosphatidylglycerophosphate/cardiolipin synthase-like enzyme